MERHAKFMILDAYSTRTLACVRSFSKHSIPFLVGGETKWDMSLFSRYCKERFTYTSPNIDISQFIRDVNLNIAKHDIDVVLPTSEAAILACDCNRENIDAELLIPTRKEIEILFNKSNTLRLAKSLDIPIPRTVHIEKSQIDSLGDLYLEYPLIIKPETSEFIDDERVVNCGNTVYVFAKSDLIQEVKTMMLNCRSILIQEFIDGYGVGVSGIFEEGEPVALIGHRRIRESNPTGGPSAVAESIDIGSELLGNTKRLMKKVGYTGPAMIEYKIDRRTDSPVLMEVNARFWGSILLSLAAGLDLPYIFWKTINGIEIQPEETEYVKGIIGRSIFADTKSLILILRGKPDLWPGYFPGRLDSAKKYISLFSCKTSTNLVLWREDPAPFYRRILYEMMVRKRR